MQATALTGATDLLATDWRPYGLHVFFKENPIPACQGGAICHSINIGVAPINHLSTFHLLEAIIDLASSVSKRRMFQNFKNWGLFGDSLGTGYMTRFMV